jgi:hypothetical protein
VRRHDEIYSGDIGGSIYMATRDCGRKADVVGIGTVGKCQSSFAVYNSTISIFASGLDKVNTPVAYFSSRRSAIAKPACVE